jgi:hypothetical protein
MKTTRQLSLLFLGVYILMWVLGPATQLLFIVNQPLHTSWGLSEPLVREQGFEWLLADEMAIAWADMTYLVAGVVFVVGAFLRRPWSLAFGLYSLAAWFFIMILLLIRWSLLDRHGVPVVQDKQKLVFTIYALIHAGFCLFGMIYLWLRRKTYD